MNKINLKDFDGAFVGQPVKKTIKFKIGNAEYEGEVYVRPLSYKTAVSDIMSLSGDSNVLPARIEACICDEHGEPLYTAGDVTGETDPERGPMCPELALALVKVIQEVNTASKMKRSPK